MNFLSQEKFDRLLAWLHPDRARAGTEYERIRQGLIKYFGSMLAWRVADDLADQTLDRVAKKVGSLPLYWDDPPDWKALCLRLARQDDSDLRTLRERILELLPTNIREAIQAGAATNDYGDLSRSEFLAALSQLLQRRDFYQANYFEGGFITDEAQALLSREETILSNDEVRRLNLLLLEAAFPMNKLPYCKAVARYIYLEYVNSRSFLTENAEDEELEREQQRAQPAAANPEEELERAKREEEHERMLECQQRCLQNLSEESRTLIAMYYGIDEDAGPSETVIEEAEGHIDIRKRLAERLGMSRNTLRVRLHRLRAVLRLCIVDCMRQQSRE